MDPKPVKRGRGRPRKKPEDLSKENRTALKAVKKSPLAKDGPPTKTKSQRKPRQRRLQRADNRQAILNALMLGLSRSTAAAIAHVSNEMLQREVELDPDFHAQVLYAEANNEQTLVAMVYNSAKAGTWQAAAWMLERKYPKKWGKIDRHLVQSRSENTNRTTVITDANVSHLTKEDLMSLVRELDGDDA
jgi:hypothetical protein